MFTAAGRRELLVSEALRTRLVQLLIHEELLVPGAACTSIASRPARSSDGQRIRKSNFRYEYVTSFHAQYKYCFRTVLQLNLIVYIMTRHQNNGGFCQSKFITRLSEQSRTRSRLFTILVRHGAERCTVRGLT